MLPCQDMMEETSHCHLQFHLCFHPIPLKPCWPGHWSRSWFDGLHPICSRKLKTAAFSWCSSVCTHTENHHVSSSRSFCQLLAAAHRNIRAFIQAAFFMQFGRVGFSQRRKQIRPCLQAKHSSYSLKNGRSSHVCNVGRARCSATGLMRPSPDRNLLRCGAICSQTQVPSEGFFNGSVSRWYLELRSCRRHCWSI